MEKIKKPLSLILVIVITIIAIAATLTIVLFVNKSYQNDMELNESGFVMPDKVKGNGITVISSVISSSEYDMYGISADAEQALHLTAVIEPLDSESNEVVWSVEWVDSTASWASGKTVTDYVSVTPTKDGALTATAQCLKSFGSQIQIIASVRGSYGVTAKCICDYRKKINSLKIVFSDSSYKDSEKFGTPESTAIVAESAKRTNFNNNANTHTSIVFANHYLGNAGVSATDGSVCEKIALSLFPVYSDYTIDSEYTTYSVDFKYTSEIKNELTTALSSYLSYCAFQDSNISCVDREVLTERAYPSDTNADFCTGKYFFLTGIINKSLSPTLIHRGVVKDPAFIAIHNKAFSVFANHRNDEVAELNVTVNSDYDTAVFSFGVKYDVSIIRNLPSTITLNQTSYVF